MTSDSNRPSEGAIREAVKRSGYDDYVTDSAIKSVSHNPCAYPGLILAAQLIEKYEPDTLVDPVTRRAREICAEVTGYVPSCFNKDALAMQVAMHALKVGMGS